MAARHLVGSTYRSWKLYLPIIITLACLGYGLIGLHEGVPDAPVVLGAAWVGLVIIVALLLVIASRRRFVELAPEAFSVFDRDGRKDHSYKDVEAAASLVTPDFEKGIQKSVTYSVRIWTADPGASKPIVLKHAAALEGMDETETWIQGLQECLLERAQSELGMDRSLRGEGWELRRDEFRLLGSDASQTVRVDDVQAVDIYDGKVCVWKVGEEEPVCRFPLEGASAWMLTPLLRELAPERPDDEEPPAGSLGRVLFERGSAPDPKGLLFIPVGLLFIIGAVLLFYAESTGWGVVFGIAGAIAVFAGWPSKLFRCHEWGVREVRLKGERVIRYGDMDSFTYSATRRFMNGAYQGTDFKLTFGPKPGAGEAIIHSTTLQGFDQELEIIQEHISKVIASHMVSDLAEDRPVQWTPNLRFLPDGVEYTPSGILGKKAPVTIPFEDVANFELDQGVFHLWVHDKDKSVIQENVSEPNFFPGFHLLQRIFEPEDESEGEQGDGEGEEAGGDEE
ncbi:MAG: hypothetical protein ACYTKD_04430 [Planctomycetota bacterium]|jgi:hypothetical protein